MPCHSPIYGLQWIEFQQNLIKDQIPNMIELSLLVNKDINVIKDVSTHYNKQKPVATGFYIPIVKAKHS